MLRATDNLRADHRLTRRAIRALAAVADGARTGARFATDDCATVLRFLREFVLAVHMRKEDEWLGPAVAMRGCERAAGLVGELLLLREEISELIHTLMLFWEPSGALTEAERLGFAETVDALVVRLQRRERLEEEQLFPACDSCVPLDDQIDWPLEFERLERDRGSRDQWSATIESLAQRWHV